MQLIQLSLWVSSSYCWKEDFTLKWGCVGVSTSLGGLARIWYPSWAQIFPLYKRWKGFWSPLGLVQRVIRACLMCMLIEWFLFLFYISWCTVGWLIILFIVLVFCYIQTVTLNNVVSKLHAILQGTGYLTVSCRLSGLTGRWWITGRCVHVKWWSWPAYRRDAWIRLDKLRGIMGTIY